MNVAVDDQGPEMPRKRQGEYEPGREVRQMTESDLRFKLNREHEERHRQGPQTHFQGPQSR